MDDRKKMIALVTEAHNAVTDKAITNHSTFGMPYSEQIAIEADTLMDKGVVVPTRCKDCGNREVCDFPKGRVWCRKMGRYMKENGFCSEGSRRE